MLNRLVVPIVIVGVGLLLYFGYTDVSNAVENTTHKTCKAVTALNKHTGIKQTNSICQ